MRLDQPVTIVPPAPLPSGISLTRGTKVLLEDGSEIGRVTRIVLTADINEAWRAQIDLLPTAGVMKGMVAVVDQKKASWWRTWLCRLAGVQLQVTTLDGEAHEYRQP